MAVTNDLVTDRRVLRHVETLRDAGFEVSVIHRGNEAMKTRYHKGWLFYAEYNFLLVKQLVREQPDMVWANDTDTLLGCWVAAKRRRCHLVMDAHELFPEVPEIRHKPIVKWVWRTIERLLMPQCDALLTVCDSIADYYRQNMCVRMEVVRNLGTARTITPSYTKPSNHTVTLLYQGSVNLGRGVDWAIDALEWLPDCRLVVAGNGDLLEQMKLYAAAKPWNDRVLFLGRLSPTELERLTPEADVGLVMLEDMGLSYHYALPNRIGDFVAAGVPMVVSDLPEMSRVVRKYGVGEVMHGQGAKPLAESVEKLLSRQWNDDDFSMARRDMDWNKEKEKLLQICYTTFS